MEKNWTYQEFHAFAMLYAANADGTISIEEEDLIAPMLPPERYLEIRQLFRQCSDAVALNLILAYKDEYCATPADKARILADMRQVFEAHRGFEQIERAVHHMFERML